VYPVTLSEYDYRYASDLCLFGTRPVPWPKPALGDCGAFHVAFNAPILSLDDTEHAHIVVIVARHPSYGAVVGAWAADSDGNPISDLFETWTPIDYPTVISDPSDQTNEEIARTYLWDKEILR